MANKYVETADVAAYLGIDGTNTTLLADLEVKIAIAEEVVEHFCNTEFVYDPVESSEILNGNGRTHLPLPKYLVSLTSIQYLDTTEVVSSTVTATDIYKVHANFNRNVYSSLEFKDGSTFPTGAQNVKVIGVWGLQTIPNTIKLGIYLTIQNIYNIAMRDANVMSAEDIYRKVEYVPAVKYDRLSAAANIVPPQAQMLLKHHQFLNKWLAGE